MKISQNKNGTFDATQIPADLFHAFADLAADLGDGNAVLRFDKRLFEPWARPNREIREALGEFATASKEWANYDWDNRFATLERPKFARRKP